MTLPPFDEVVTEHGQVVLRVCRALLGPVDADDAWSETFLAALRAYPDLRDDSNVRGWLVTIAHRKAIDQLRAAGRDGAALTDTDGRRRLVLLLSTDALDATATGDPVLAADPGAEAGADEMASDAPVDPVVRDDALDTLAAAGEGAGETGDGATEEDPE